jgi:uncharacterized membrane protein
MTRITPVSILVSAVLILLLDLPWLYFNQTQVSGMIRSIQGSPVKLRIIPALLVYLFLAYLVTIPKTISEAFLLGVATYGVYEGTNYSIFTNYNGAFAVADTLWGGVLLSTAWWILRRLNRVIHI